MILHPLLAVKSSLFVFYSAARIKTQESNLINNVGNLHSILPAALSKESAVYPPSENQIAVAVKRFMEKRVNRWGYV